jgi:hypothetical protein
VNLLDATGEREGSTSEPTAPPYRRSRLRRLVRPVVFGVGFVILAESVSRYLESHELATAIDEIRQDRGKPIPIGDTDETEPSVDASDGDERPVDDVTEE